MLVLQFCLTRSVFVDSGFSFEHNWFYELVTPLMDHDDLDITWGRTYTSVVDDMDRMFAYLGVAEQ